MKAAIVKAEHFINSNLWEMFPLINVDKVKDIPCDYPGPMAVPITFMDKLYPGQFQILGISGGNWKLENGRTPYKRIIVRNLHPEIPGEIDLVEYCHMYGLTVDFDFVEAGTGREHGTQVIMNKTEAVANNG